MIFPKWDRSLGVRHLCSGLGWCLILKPLQFTVLAILFQYWSFVGLVLETPLYGLGISLGFHIALAMCVILFTQLFTS